MNSQLILGAVLETCLSGIKKYERSLSAGPVFLIYCSLLTSVPSYLANIFDFLSQILSHGFREATLRFVRYVLWSRPLPREYLIWKENTLLSLQLSLHWFVAFVGILRREEILFRKVPVFFFFSLRTFWIRVWATFIIIDYFYPCGVFWVGVQLFVHVTGRRIFLSS